MPRRTAIGWTSIHHLLESVSTGRLIPQRNVTAILRDQCADRKRLAAPDREDGHLRTMGVAAFYEVHWEARDGQGRAGSLGWLRRCEGEVSVVVGVAR